MEITEKQCQITKALTALDWNLYHSSKGLLDLRERQVCENGFIANKIVFIRPIICNKNAIL
jgi:hypothetical protein